MTVKEDMEIKKDTGELPHLKIKIIEEMEDLERKLQEANGQSFKKTTYWNQLKSGLGESSEEQLLLMNEHLGKIAEQLVKIELNLGKIVDSLGKK